MDNNMHIYVLNLDRRSERWYRVNKLLSGKNIVAERWSAIDGATIEFLSTYHQYKKQMVTKPQELACALSHIEIIKDAQVKGYDRIVIFEDDIYLHKNFSLNNLPDADIVYLGGTQFKWFGDEQPPYYKSRETLGTFGMVIKSTMFQTIIDTWEVTPWPIDKMYSEHIQAQPNKYTCYTMFPNLVACDVRDSDIREPWNLEQHAKSVKWELSDYNLGPRPNWLELTTFLVNDDTLDNPCITSIKTVWPNAKIQLVNAGQITTEYVIPCQPKYYFGQDTQIDKFFGFLENKFNYAVIGGSVHTPTGTIHNCLTLTEKEGVVQQKSTIAKFEKYEDLMFKTCDKTSLFGLYRNLPNIQSIFKDSVQFFWNLKKEGEWKVAHTGQILITQAAD